MTDPLALRASREPSAPALIAGVSGAVTSWAELEEAAAMLAGRLAAIGVRRGDRVGVVEAAGPVFVTALHACVRLGAALVPLPPRLLAPELRRHLLDSGAGVVLASAEAAPVVQRVVGKPGCERLGAWSFDRSLRGIEDVVPEPARNAEAEDRDVAIVYTSGSSGQPKGVRLTLHNCIASFEGCSEALGGIHSDDRWLLALGPHRVGGLSIIWRSVLSGAAVVYVPRFKEDAVRRALDRGPTLASLVPTMMHRLLDAGLTGGLRQLRAILLGGAPAAPADVVDWVAQELNVCPSYGLTESASQIAVVPPGRAGEMAGTAGLVHSRARVDVDADEGASGELLVGGAVLSPGYTDAQLTSRAFTGDGETRRLRSGDIGNLAGGLLRVAGRRDRMIVTGGEKVSPEEVEAVLLNHPGVRDALVTGVPDGVYGSVVSAAVAGEADAETLRRWCAERLARHKVPRVFRFVDVVSRSDEGKLVWSQPEH